MKYNQSDSINILLADDDEDDREFFADIIHLVNGPVQLTCTSSGSELIKKLKELSGNLPDLLFLDLNMPGKDGRECLCEMKSIDSLRNLQIIICSTSSSPDDIDYAYEKGADLYLVKPTSFSTYFERLKSVLDLFAEKKLPVRDRQKFVCS